MSTRFMRFAIPVIAVLGAASMLLPGCVGASDPQVAPGPMKIGVLLDFDSAPTKSENRQLGVELAVSHINAAGGVLGHHVQVIAAAVPPAPGPAVAEAQRLVLEEGVHAFVGPNSSAASLAVSQNVSGPLRIPTISMSATSPLLSAALDDDFFFRSVLSDVAQGPALASLAGDLGYTNVAVLYRDDPYGGGLAGSFLRAWHGDVRAVALETDQIAYGASVADSAGSGAQALIVISFTQQAIDVVRAALSTGVYDRFIFADATRNTEMFEEIGAPLIGMYGTAGAYGPETDVSTAWAQSFVDLYRLAPTETYVREAYDATIALAFAAQAAGTLDGGAIRDRLRAVTAAPGQTIPATREGIAKGMDVLARGGAINYDGIASTLDWDGNGDVRRGYIGRWRFTADGRIEDVSATYFSLD